jgi:hypothetical protein
MRRVAAGESLHIAPPETAGEGPPAGADAPEVAEPAPVPARPPPVGRGLTKEVRSPAAHGAPGAADDDLDAFLDALEAQRRDGRRSEALGRLESRIGVTRSSAERVTLLLTLAHWTAETGDDLRAARLLDEVGPRSAPHELVETAWRFALSCWRRAGRDSDAARIESRLKVLEAARPADAPLGR